MFLVIIVCIPALFFWMIQYFKPEFICPDRSMIGLESKLKTFRNCHNFVLCTEIFSVRRNGFFFLVLNTQFCFGTRLPWYLCRMKTNTRNRNRRNVKLPWMVIVPLFHTHLRVILSWQRAEITYCPSSSQTLTGVWGPGWLYSQCGHHLRSLNSGGV